MVLDKAVPASGRSRLLQACARSLDVHAVDGLIAGLQEPELVSDVTKVLASAPRNGRDPEIEAALLAVLKSGCPAWVAANVAATLLAMGNTDDASLAALDPWGATDFRWQQQGITPVEVARRLTEAGAIAGISEQALAAIGQRKAASLVLHLLSHDAKDVRVALGTIRSNCSPEHHELFSQLARIVRPPLQIESISEITAHEVETVQDAGSAGLMMMQEGVSKPVPQHLVAGIPLVSISDTRRRVTVRSEGREFAFTVSPPGAFTMDVAGVLAGFNDIMKQIGREERAFQLDWERDDTRDHGYFLCAREEPFLKAAADLCIPLRVPS
jgi:hypothetical protein